MAYGLLALLFPLNSGLAVAVSFPFLLQNLLEVVGAARHALANVLLFG